MDVPELQDAVLFAAGGVIRRYIADVSVAAEEERGLTVDGDRVVCEAHHSSSSAVQLLTLEAYQAFRCF